PILRKALASSPTGEDVRYVDEGAKGATPVMLHGAMGQARFVVQDLFNDKVTSYLQEIAPDLCERVELYTKKNPLFDEYNIENELNNMLTKR
ncbi:ribonuclease E/G-like protein, chloroplastic isoform X1, partial [Tanacetum coccineum]